MTAPFTVTYKASQLSSNHPTKKIPMMCFLKPVGVALLPRRSGTLSSSLCTRQQIRNHYSYRPRIPRAQCPCGLFHTRLRFVVYGAGSLRRHFYFHIPCRPHRQSPLEQSTQHHWRWNTIVCSNHDSCRCESHHSKRRAGLLCPTFLWKHIPIEILKGQL